MIWFIIGYVLIGIILGFTQPPEPPVLTKSPTSAPTQCIPGNVTCCFTVFTDITSVYLNGINITDSVVYNGGTGPLYIKTIEFQEPGIPSMLAIGIYDANELLNPSVIMSCTNTRLNSNWNFVSLVNDTSWTSVLTITAYEDNLPDNWYNLSYTGTSYPIKGPGQVVTYKTPNCLSPSAQNLGLYWGPAAPYLYYGVRKFIDETC